MSARGMSAELAEKGERRPRLAAATGNGGALLQEGTTCWRVSRADRAALLIDGAAYFDALRRVLPRAQREVFIVGWDIRSDISLDPLGDHTPLRSFLRRILKRRPQLQIRILVWDWPFFFSLDREPLPQLQFGLARSRRLHLVLDCAHPATACHHEKIVVIDGRLAFCGGIDLSAGRWDRPGHQPHEPGRGRLAGAIRPPFHDGMLMVEGEPARALDELARERWHRATGERLAAPPEHDRFSPWPEGVEPWFAPARVAVARTRPAWAAKPEVREIENLYVRAIGAARRCIYVENQYLTVLPLADALGARLGEPDGPEVVIIGPKECEGIIETAVMDRGRALFLERLRAADRFDRLRILHPVNAAGVDQPVPINVHAKLLIVDDRLLLVGSANLSNRSMRLDTECNLAIEAQDEPDRHAVLRARDTLLGEHLGCAAATFAARVRHLGSIVAAIDALNGGARRLEPLDIEPVALPPELVAGVALTDPSEPLSMELLESRLAPPSRRRRLLALALRVALTLLALLALALIARSDLVGESGAIAEALRLAEHNPVSWLGFAAVMVAFLLSSLLFIPVNIVIAGTGAVFGPLLGPLYALAGSLLAAALAFAIGRALGRDWVRQLASRRVTAFNRRLNRHGLLAMTVLRLFPVAPFTVVNLIAGASDLRMRDYMLGSLIGMSPGIVLMTLFGDRLGAWLRDPNVANLAVVLGIAALALGLAWTLARWSRRRTRS
ncbi:MAG: VTT domain-containing protein [Geminicoccaceae bacterium]